MHVLVTGGGGYLGSWVTTLLLERGHSVKVLDRFCFGKSNAETLQNTPQCEMIEGDIRRLQEHPGLFDGVEAVIHLASLSNDPSCDLNTEMAMDVNVESTLELAKMAAEKGVRRFVFGSSCTVYGHGVFETLDEESPANPVSTFAKSKLLAETALLRMTNDQFEPVVARAGTMYGISARMRFDLAVNQMTATAMRQQRIEVRGGGNQWRPFVHVRDAARALAAMLEAPAKDVSGEIFNVGSDSSNIRIIDLARQVAAMIDGTSIEVAKDDDDLRNYSVQFDKLRNRLGFSCAWSITDGITELHKGLEQDYTDPFESKYFNVTRVKELMATPVDKGGEPVAPRFIPLSKPSLGEEEESAVLEALRSGWLTSGPKVAAFEKSFSDTVAAKASVAVSSCTAALHLCLVQAGVGPGDEVITSPITWASTGNTIINMGAKVVFVDIDPSTLNMNTDLLEAAITEKTRVIMPVHLAGQPCDLDPICAIGKKHGIPVVEDAAHALGASYKGTPIGGYGDFACFSFYAIKNITTMEGGMIAVGDEEVAERLRFLATNGLSATAWERYGRSAIAAPMEVVEPGYKYSMGNVSAAMGIEQLKKFSTFKATRKRVATMYAKALSDINEIELLRINEDIEHSWHLFVIRFKTDLLTRTRDELAYDLRRENIGTGVHFHGLHLHQYYNEAMGMKPADFPQATAASRSILSLPLHPQITDSNVHEVVSALKKVVFHARKSKVQ
jgi:dTDP-4-amino-4,6-dideoxygalactose transaminase/nucleoside-diphosphate-sugar epimerase